MVFQTQPWLGHSGFAPGARALRCPASQHDSGNETAKQWICDYAVSQSTILSPDCLDPALAPSVWKSRNGARVQRIEDVLFPSAKAITFEENVWHAWRGTFSPATDLRDLQWWGSPGPISAAFADGSAELLKVSGIKPFAVRAPDWNPSFFQTTEWGVRGRDR